MDERHRRRLFPRKSSGAHACRVWGLVVGELKLAFCASHRAGDFEAGVCGRLKERHWRGGFAIAKRNVSVVVCVHSRERGGGGCGRMVWHWGVGATSALCSSGSEYFAAETSGSGDCHLVCRAFHSFSNFYGHFFCCRPLGRLHGC